MIRESTTAEVAIRKYCLQCSGGSRKEVHACPIRDCPLYPLRELPPAGTERRRGTEEQTTIFQMIGA